MRHIVMLDRECLDKFKGLFSGDIYKNFNDKSICYGMLEENIEGKLLPVALLMSDVGKSAVLITWLYVIPEYREQGVMSELMNKYIDNLRKSKLIREIYCSVTDEDIAYFLSSQFGFSYDGFGSGRVMVSSLGDLIDINSAKKDKNPARRLCEMDKVQLSNLNKYLMAHSNIPVGVPLPINPSDYMDISMAIEVNGEIHALILLTEEPDAIVVSYAYVKENCGPLLLYIMAAIYDELSEYPPETKIIAGALGNNSEELFAKLFKKSISEIIYECSYSF